MAIDFNDVEAGDAYVLGLLKVVCDKQARARMTKRTVLLSKSMPATVAVPKKTKPQSRPVAKTKSVMIVAAKPKLSPEQLLRAIDQACTAGRLSGHDGLVASELVKRGQDLPQGTLVALGMGI